MRWPAFIAAIFSRRSAFNSRDADQSAPTSGASGHAVPIFRSQRRDGWILSERDRLATAIQKARRQRRPSKALCSEAARLTTNILAGGAK
jgi:hypothetical protein